MSLFHIYQTKKSAERSDGPILKSYIRNAFVVTLDFDKLAFYQGLEYEGEFYMPILEDERTCEAMKNSPHGILKNALISFQRHKDGSRITVVRAPKEELQFSQRI